MMKNLMGLILLVTCLTSQAQSPQVPPKMEFAGLKLKITESARKEIQADVDALTQNSKYYGEKLARVEMYFPTIERIFKKEGLPDDFKYLAIQESALISDAVSTSKAVGFWQFKKETAAEVGLRVDNQVDERKNIVSSTHAAAKYLQKNNYFFNNWVLALQAYQMGAGGVMEAEDDKYFGARSMTINKRTYWYVKKFLSYKIAFERSVAKLSPSKAIGEYIRGENKTLKDIAKELDVDLKTLEHYNKWLKANRVPNDKQYTVIVPPDVKIKPEILASERTVNKQKVNIEQPSDNMKLNVGKVSNSALNAFLIKINGLPAIVAQSHDTPELLASQGGIPIHQFRKYNDLNENQNTIDGGIYYLASKRSKAKIYYHTTKKGETTWSISQKYGIRLTNLLRKNRMVRSEEPAAGRILWLRRSRPAKQPIEFDDSFVEASSENIIAKNVSDKSILEGVEESNQTDTLAVPNNTNLTAPDPDQEVVNETEPSRIEDNSTITIEKLPDLDLEEGDQPFENPQGLNKTIHKIEKGETLYSISRAYNVKLGDLIQWNNLKSSTLAIGQELTVYSNENKLPDNKKSKNKQESYIYHEVVKGDTMFSISKKYEVSINDIKDWNGKTDNNIKVGEKLRIKNTPR